MPTGTITNTTKDLNGNVVAGVTCVVTLQPPGGFRISDATEVAPQVTFTSDGSGFWSQAFEQTSNISPTGSFYVVQEQYPASAGGYREYAFTVGAGTATLFASLLATNPPSPTTNYLTQAQGDARYLSINTAVANIGINVASAPYNAVADSGTTNNLTAFQSAVNASKTGDIIFVPTGASGGYYQISGAASGGTVLSITHDLTLYGQDGVRTKIKFGPNDPTGTLNCIVVSDGVKLRLVNMDIEGIDTDASQQVSLGILSGVAAGSNTTSTIELVNCTMSKFGQCIKAQGDDVGFTVAHTVNLEDSSLTSNAEGQCLLIHSSLKGSTVRVRNCIFDMEQNVYLNKAATATASGVLLTDTTQAHTFTADTTTGSKVLANVVTTGRITNADTITGAGIPAATAVTLGGDLSHNFYLHVATSLDCGSGTIFKNAGGYNIQFFAGPNSTPNFVNVHDTQFIGAHVGAAAYLCNPQIQQSLANCTFFHDSSADNIRMQGTGLVMTGCKLLSGSVGITVLSGTTAGELLATSCWIQTQVSRVLSGATWGFHNCTFKPGGNFTAVLCEELGTGEGTYEFVGCRFLIGSLTSANWMLITKGNVVIRGGNTDNTGITAYSISGSGQLEVSDHTWADTTAILSNTGSGSVIIKPRQATGPNITAAAGITFDPNYASAHITAGTTAINTVTAGSTSGNANKVNWGPFFALTDVPLTFTGGNMATTLSPSSGSVVAFVSASTGAPWYLR